MTFLKRSVALLLSVSLVLATAPGGFAYQTDQSAAPPPPQAAQQTPEQLQQLVAPIALYPDALVAQILAAATYPAEVVEADRWMQQHSDLKGKKLADEVNKQSWDPSVKALAQFPSVLANMDRRCDRPAIATSRRRRRARRIRSDRALASPRRAPRRRPAKT